jgi:hypothetical protein
MSDLDDYWSDDEDYDDYDDDEPAQDDDDGYANDVDDNAHDNGEPDTEVADSDRSAYDDQVDEGYEAPGDASYESDGEEVDCVPDTAGSTGGSGGSSYYPYSITNNGVNNEVCFTLHAYGPQRPMLSAWRRATAGTHVNSLEAAHTTIPTTMAPT